MTTMLVTGGAGFIGHHLVRQLVSEGHEVRVLDDFSRGTPRRLSDLQGKIETVQGDVRCFEDVMKATKDMEVVWHLAAVNGTENFYKHPETVLEVGVKGTMHTMDAAIEHGCKRYIFASSAEVYQEPTVVPTSETERIIIPDIKNPRFSYSGSKIIGELLVMHYLTKRGIDALVFRPHNIYAADMGSEHVIPQFIARMKKLKEESPQRPITFPIQGDGSETRSFCYISDLIDGLMIMYEHGAPGELYHIGNTEEVTIGELAKLIAVTLNSTVTIAPGEKLKGSTARRCPDIRKMHVIGYKPKVSLKEGLKLTCKEECARLDSHA